MSLPTEEIKARLDILDVVSETVQLKKSGKGYSGFCPFHHNVNTPSFHVWPETGTWRCFGACDEGGDIFKFVMKREGWDFSETLRHLAEKAGVELRKQTPQEIERQEEHQRLRDLLDDAARYFHNLLVNNPAAFTAREYLAKRQLNAETIETYELGYSLPGWDNTIKYLREKGYSDQEMIDAGVVSQNDQGRVYDRFRNRIMFPIRDERGRMAGFGARAIDPDDMPKYLNSPQSAIFDKSRLLYGLDKARREIRSQDQVVIVEGYMDVIAPAQAGFVNLVSPMGTALTPDQIRMLKRLTRNMVMALDADEAGIKATMRGLDVARDTMDREADPIFNAAGLVRHEGRLQADIRVSTLPDGMDPDELVNENPQDWADLIANAKPVVIHVMESLAAGEDLEDPKVKSDIAKQVMPLIMDVPNAIERDAYVQRLARLLQVDERSLMTVRSPRKKPRRQNPNYEQTPPPAFREDEAVLVTNSEEQAIYKLEAYCLSIIMREPELLYRINRALGEAGLKRIAHSDFQSTDHQEIFRLALGSIEQDFVEPSNFALETLPLPLLETADVLLEKTDNLNPKHDKVLDDLIRTFLQLRERNVRKNTEHIHFMLMEAQENDSDQVRPFMEREMQHLKELNLIQHAIGKYTNRSLDH